MEDQKIIELYFQRDEQAIAETKNKYHGYCSTIAYRILTSFEDTEECVSDTYLKTWNAIPPAVPEQLRLFVGRITRNLAMNRLRTAAAKRRGGDTVQIELEELKDCLSDTASPEDALDEQLISDAVNSFLESLSEEKRVAFVLRYWYLYSIPEISSRMHISESRLKSILFRLRKQLKAHLEREGIVI